MFDFTRQVQIVTDQARRGAARLAGAEPPSYEDTEITIDQLKARLAKTIAYLKTLDGKQIDASGDREIAFPLGGGVTGRMKGSDCNAGRGRAGSTPPPAPRSARLRCAGYNRARPRPAQAGRRPAPAATRPRPLAHLKG